jgi:hypothetical protein
MVNVADYLHREAEAKGGPEYDRGRVNRDVRQRCDDHDLDYDKVMDRLTARRLSRK